MNDGGERPDQGRRVAGRALIVLVLAAAVAAAFLMRPGRTTRTEAAAGQEPAPGALATSARPAEPPAPTQVAEPPAGPIAAAPMAPAAATEATVPLPRLLDLGADKCVPCKMMAPILAELRRDYAGRFEVVFIDVWKERARAAEYGIRLIPTQIFFDAQGRELIRHQGFLSREDILRTWREQGFDFGGS